MDLLISRNGIFRSRGAGWIPYKTGVRKLLEIVSNNKGNEFPYNSIISMYKNHGLVFTDIINENNIGVLDRWFVFYLMYDNKQIIRQQDVDHIFPKADSKEISHKRKYGIFVTMNLLIVAQTEEKKMRWNINNG
jgi:hypothetical protein